MSDPREKVVRFIEDSNAFEVLGHFRRLGVLDKADIEKAMQMDRTEFLNFVKTKAGLIEQGANDETRND